jgi:hypothetical protein
VLAEVRGLPEWPYGAVVSAPERIPVCDLGRYGRAWLLSIDGRDAVPADGQPLCHGFGLPFPKPFSAAFVYAGRVWLQVGKQRWDVARIRAVKQEREGIKRARYTVSFNDGSSHSVMIKFPPTVALFRVIDPTHDEIESWSEDIMKMLPYTAADGWRADPTSQVADWAARVLPMWTSGVPCVQDKTSD